MILEKLLGASGGVFGWFYNALTGRNMTISVCILHLLRWGQTSSDRDHIKTHKSAHIGTQFGDKMVEFW